MYGYDNLCEHGFDFGHPTGTGSYYCSGPTPREEQERQNAEAPAYLRAKLTGEPDTDAGWTTLVVTFTDGEVVRYPNTRFLTTLGGIDPIVLLPNGWLSFESDEQTVTVANVREFRMDHLSVL